MVLDDNEMPFSCMFDPPYSHDYCYKCVYSRT